MLIAFERFLAGSARATWLPSLVIREPPDDHQVCPVWPVGDDEGPLFMDICHQYPVTAHREAHEHKVLCGLSRAPIRIRGTLTSMWTDAEDLALRSAAIEWLTARTNDGLDSLTADGGPIAPGGSTGRALRG